MTTEEQMTLCGVVRVWVYGQTFMARCGKHRASCTRSAGGAVEACAKKVMGGAPYQLHLTSDDGSWTIWRT